MRRFTLSVIIAVLFSGCSLNSVFVKSVDGYSTAILPEYKEYIKNDSKLDDESKRIRTQSADKFQELIDEALKEEK